MKLRCRKCGRVLYDERHVRIDRPISCRCGGVMAIENTDSEADLGIHPLLAERIKRRDTGSHPIEPIPETNKGENFQVPSRITIKSEEGTTDNETPNEESPPASNKTQVARRQKPQPPKDNFTDLRIEGYEVLEQVGKGAMGAVYRARHLASGRDAAVKILAEELAARPDFVMRFEREAAALRAVHHSGVVSILDSGETDGKHYLCMEYVHGSPLRHLLRDGALPPSRALTYARQIVQALAAAHERGVIHRDLKPENVLVRRPEGQNGTHPDEELVLVDFGLAGIIDEADDPHPNLTKSAITMGTVNYMAPEQRLDAKRVDHRADIYSCGVMLYELVTGDLPLGRFALPTERGVPVPLSVDECIVKALARQPSERYQNALEMDEMLARVAREVRDLGERESLLPQKSKRSQKQPFQLYDTRIGGSEDALHVEALGAEELDKRLAADGGVYGQPKVASQMPWVKKPVLLGGVAALLFGALAGIIFTDPPVEEVILVGDDIQTVKSNWENISIAPLNIEEGQNVNVASLMAPLNQGVQASWKVQSQGWQVSEKEIQYVNYQDNNSYWRRSPSFLMSDKIFEPQGAAWWAIEMALPPMPSKLLPKDKRHVIQNILKEYPLMRRGGVFIYNPVEKRAIGFMASAEGTCTLESFRQTSQKWISVQKETKSCNELRKGKKASLALKCDKSKDECEGWLAKKKRVAGIKNAGIVNGTWFYALGCSNATCSFAPALNPHTGH